MYNVIEGLGFTSQEEIIMIIIQNECIKTRYSSFSCTLFFDTHGWRVRLRYRQNNPCQVQNLYLHVHCALGSCTVNQ